MNKDVEVSRRMVEVSRRRWFDVRRHRSQRRQSYKGGREFVNRTQCENTRVFVVYRGWVLIRVVPLKIMCGCMAMNQDMGVPLLLSLVDMFRRKDGQRPHHRAEHPGEQPGQLHVIILPLQVPAHKSAVKTVSNSSAMDSATRQTSGSV